MPPGEIPVTCPGCGYQLRVPVAAVRRNNLYCPQCGKNIPLADAMPDTAPDQGTRARKPRRPTYRPTKRR